MLYAQTIGRFVAGRRDALARRLVQFRVTPNAITVTGCVISCAAGALLAAGRFRTGALVLVLAGACDMLDGAVAKAMQHTTKFGGVLDSSLDRISDGAIFTGLVVHYARLPRYDCVVVGCLALIGAFCTSYVRARAENVIEKCDVGFWERGERVVYIILALLFSRVPTALYVLAVCGNMTALHRLVHTREQIAGPPGEEHARRPLRLERAIYNVMFWKYDRFTWQYDAAVSAVILFTLLVKL